MDICAGAREFLVTPLEMLMIVGHCGDCAAFALQRSTVCISSVSDEPTTTLSTLCPVWSSLCLLPLGAEYYNNPMTSACIDNGSTLRSNLYTRLELTVCPVRCALDSFFYFGATYMYIVCLYMSCASHLSFFLHFFLTHLLSYLSFSLRIDQLRF